MKYPQRPRSHELEDASVRYFEQSLPPAWTTEHSQHDYGIDLHVSIFEESKATNLEFIVQLKSSEKPSQEDEEHFPLRVATYNYLWDLLQVVLLVKYVASEKEAYWLLLRDVPAPTQDHDSFTVHIPRANRLSQISWDTIRVIVSDVTGRKLMAQRVHDLERKEGGRKKP